MDAYAAQIAAAVEARRPKPKGLPVLPPASVPHRAPTDAELDSCRAGKGLLKTARKLGWDVDVYFARGPYMGAKGEDLGMADGLTLVFRWGTLTPEAWCWWTRRNGKWNFESATIFAPLATCTGPLFRHWLAGTTPPPPKPKPSEGAA